MMPSLDRFELECDLGDIHKPRRQLRGPGVSQMITLLKALLSKSAHEEWRGSKIPKNLTTWFMDAHLPDQNEDH